VHGSRLQHATVAAPPGVGRQDRQGPASKNPGWSGGGGVVTYSARGVQNVAIVSGFVGVYNSIAPDIGGGNTTVTIFGLQERP
jgi:Ethanolamine utilization protein EutJ (predicted chaperonin)